MARQRIALGRAAPRVAKEERGTVIQEKICLGFFRNRPGVISGRTEDVDTVIVCGCTTSGCVRATVVDALQYGLHAIVPREAVGDRAPQPHEASLFDIDMKYGDVVRLQDVKKYLRRAALD